MNQRQSVRADGDVDRGVIWRAGHAALSLDRLMLQVVRSQCRIDDLLRCGDALGFFDSDFRIALRDLPLRLLFFEQLLRGELLFDRS